MSIGRFGAIFLFLGVGIAQSQNPPLTTIQDTLYEANGSRMNATAVITWNAFQASDTSNVDPQTLTIQIVNGSLYVQLVPNTNAVPAAPYTVTYSSDGIVQFQEVWMVPPSSTPLRVSAVRIGTTTTVPSPGSSVQVNSGSGALTSGNSTSGPIAESSVTGLVTDLSARPLKGPAFGTGRVAIVDQNGDIDTVVGNLTDCVYVGGTSGPCFDPTQLPSYSDGETPGGVVDGNNTSYALVGVPTPPASLELFRNGMLQKQGFDYTLTGQVVQFLAGAGPQPGDTLMAWYRMAPAAQSGSSSDEVSTPLVIFPSLAAQVLCSANGTQTGSPTLATLGTCTLPGNLLQPGDRVEIRALYSHTGSNGGFNVAVVWGATTILQRAGGINDTMFAAKTDASTSTGPTAFSGDTFGAVLPLLQFMNTASDTLTAPITISFQADLTAASTDTIALTNYTVIRYPAISNP